jgi:hypothetical protein
MCIVSRSLVVTIPVYKAVEDLSSFERISIQNTINKTPKGIPIFLLAPEGLLVDAYSEFFLNSFQKVQYPKNYFISIYSYNDLLKSKLFYEPFKEFDFMLLVQTDAYIFEFDFEPFMGYDFVGGPWQHHIFDTHIKTLHCGSGGFSLRNIHKAIDVLNQDIQALPFRKVRRYTFESEFHTEKSFFKKAWDTLYFYFFQNRIKDGKNGMPFLYEDVFWSLIVPVVYPQFKVADGQTALQFAFDTQPEICFEQNNRQLPKGCHGFNKYNPEFWEQFIPFKFA